MHQSCILQSAKARTGTAARIAVRPHSLSLSRVFYLLADSAELSRDPCVLHAKNIMKYKSVGARSRGVRGPSRDCESGKSSPCNTQRDATGAILPVIKTFGGNPAVCMGFSPTVNSRFAETYGETLRAACILFADLMNSPSLPSSVLPCAVRAPDSSAALPRQPRSETLLVPVRKNFSLSCHARLSHTNRITVASPTTPVVSILRTRTCPYRFRLNHRDVNARVDKTRTRIAIPRLREMLTHAADDARCHDRGFATWPPVILSLYLYNGIIRGYYAADTHAYSNERASRWFSSRAFEDSCYTRRDFTRLMHSYTYPSRRFRIGKHGRAWRDIIGTMESGCVFSCRCSLHSFCLLFVQLCLFLFFARITTSDYDTSLRGTENF